MAGRKTRDTNPNPGNLGLTDIVKKLLFLQQIAIYQVYSSLLYWDLLRPISMLSAWVDFADSCSGVARYGLGQVYIPPWFIIHGCVG